MNKQMSKKTRNFILFVAAIMLGLWLGRLLRPVNSQLRGALTFDRAALPSAEYNLGDFIVRWDNQYGQLTVEHPSRPGFALWQTLPGESFIQAAQGEETVTQKGGMFEVRDSWSDTCSEQEMLNIRHSPEGQPVLLVEGRLYCQSGKDISFALYIVLHPYDPDRLEICAATDFNRVFLTYASNPEEHFFGFGEQFSYVDMKGQRVPIWVSEQGVGRGDQPITFIENLVNDGAGGDKFTTYAPAAFYMTSQMRALMLLDSDYATFDLRAADRVQIEAFGYDFRVQIFSRTTPAEILAKYTQVVGRPSPLPDWVHSGAIVGLQGGTEKVRQVYEKLRARDVPMAALWLPDWTGERAASLGAQTWWNWEVDYDHYPGWDEMVQDLKRDGVRVMVYINPNLVDVSSKPNARRNLYQEALRNKYLVKTPINFQDEGLDYGMVDLTYPTAVAWLSDVIERQVIGAGASGWMADLGEGLPYQNSLHWYSYDETASTLHNQWPIMWAFLNRQIVEQSGEELVFFTRSGSTGSKSTSVFFSFGVDYIGPQAASMLFWTGDQLVSWGKNDGIKSAVTGLNSGGLSGLAFNHSDIGGYTTITRPLLAYHRSEELLLRWMEMNAFTLIFRTNEGSQPENNIQVYTNGATLDAFARWSKVYAALFEYRKSLIAEAAQTGMPVVRHPFLHYPDDPEVWKITYQEFMLGADFLIAPVTDKGADTVKVYLPAGEWVHLWSGETYAGGQTITIAAPLGQPAVFYIEGSAWGQDFARTLNNEGLMP